MKEPLTFAYLLGWIFGLLLIAVGILNLILVHPVPGLAYFLFSLIYLPPANAKLKERFGISVPLVLKIILGIIIFIFTFGVSDLGDRIDKL